jgi:hypothetical protein
MTQENKRVFKADINGETVELAVIRPTSPISNAAHMHYQRAWSNALKNGCLLQKKLNDYIIEQGLWDEDRQQQYDALIVRLRDGEEALAHGKIKLTEGWDIAVKDMKIARIQLQILLAERNALEQNSAEGVAEQERFNFLVSRCVVDNKTGANIFVDVDDYINRSEEPWAFQAAAIFSQLNNGLDADFLGSLPENKFLKTWGFVNDNFQLIDKDGNLIDEEGKLINEVGQWVNAEGQLVDEEGKALDEEGNLEIAEDAVFYDDDGNPIVPPNQKKAAPKKKRGRPKKKQDKEESSEVEYDEAKRNLVNDKLDDDAEVTELQKT